ncbi:MAG: guanylate kinase [Candidatus Omnitrophica bacterium]|nr:guanylate kinase [Candidatus Omnitrophota bacterium]
MSKKEQIVVVVSAPSGAGKTTIINGMLEKMPMVTRSISCTTREPRDGEKEGLDYIFLKEEEFEKIIKDDGFLEWEQNFGYYYGTRIQQVEEALEEGKDVILNIDVKGAKRVKRKLPESISVFIMAPSLEELANRLKARKREDGEEVKKRIKEAEKEIAAGEEYDYMIINQDLDTAVKELCEIIILEKASRAKRGGK